jgi:tetratricopeptide (TPR) repeat protein
VHGLLLVLSLAAAVMPDNGSQEGLRDRAAALAADADKQAAAGNLAAAIRRMEEAERVAPDWAELKVNLAALRSEAGDYPGAISAARAALQINAELDGAWFNLGLAQLRAGDAAAAVDALKRFGVRQQTAPAAVAALGLALFRLERFPDSAAALQKAVDAGLRDPETLWALGRAWLRIGEPDRAAAAAGLLTAVSPRSAQALLLDGDIKDWTNDWAAAEASYRAALQADPRIPGGRYALGLLLYKQRRYEDAAAEFDRELSTNPDYPPALYYKAVLELDRGNPEAAIPGLRRLTEVAPRHADGWRDLGRALLDRDSGTNALPALQRAIALAPEDARAHFLMGRALEQEGRSAEARAAFARAVELNQQLRQRLQQRVSGKRRPPTSR